MARTPTTQRSTAEAAAAERITYRDTKFKARTLLPPSGGVLAVQGGEVATADAEEIAWLDRHPDFERAAE
ncbi:hypothetical protein KTE26_11425 [Ralstonia mannitolilytica]|uniref:hypothetical protein n=1 Tax=Ralstonia mannitolilytica TaxID=105219 RepID=UPI000CEE2B12|nr:hypothetical protein [Ralstonia mannitolilytica]MBU9579045.1 hypothetical protein [Ralstonia mannitolilytica]